MNYPNRCPFCQQPRQTNQAIVTYDCGTQIHPMEHPERFRSRDCRIIERDDLKDKLADALERARELEARCMRLTEAAREVYLDSIASDHQWSTNEARNMRALRDVLEKKP